MDAEERALTGGTAPTPLEGGNADHNGNYNVQVLSEALQRRGWALQRLGSRHSLVDALEHRQAILLHRPGYEGSGHWFTWYKFAGIWHTMDSLRKRPVPLSQCELDRHAAGLMHRHSYFSVAPEDVMEMDIEETDAESSAGGLAEAAAAQDTLGDSDEHLDGASDPEAMKKLYADIIAINTSNSSIFATSTSTNSSAVSISITPAIIISSAAAVASSSTNHVKDITSNSAPHHIATISLLNDIDDHANSSQPASNCDERPTAQAAVTAGGDAQCATTTHTSHISTTTTRGDNNTQQGVERTGTHTGVEAPRGTVPAGEPLPGSSVRGDAPPSSGTITTAEAPPAGGGVERTGTGSSNNPSGSRVELTRPPTGVEAPAGGGHAVEPLPGGSRMREAPLRKAEPDHLRACENASSAGGGVERSTCEKAPQTGQKTGQAERRSQTAIAKSRVELNHSAPGVEAPGDVDRSVEPLPGRRGEDKAPLQNTHDKKCENAPPLENGTERDSKCDNEITCEKAPPPRRRG